MIARQSETLKFALWRSISAQLVRGFMTLRLAIPMEVSHPEHRSRRFLTIGPALYVVLEKMFSSR